MFIEALQRACEKKDRSINEVVTAIGCPRSTITYWRQGNMPTLKTVYALAAELGVKPSELIED